MTPDPISPDLKSVLRRLRLSRILDTLPERLVLARQHPLPHQDFLLLILTDEVTRRDGLATTLRAQRAGLDPGAQLEHWDATAHVTFDRALLSELVTLRFLEAHQHVALVGPSASARAFLPTPSATSPVAAGTPSSPCARTRCSRPSSTPA